MYMVMNYLSVALLVVLLFSCVSKRNVSSRETDEPAVNASTKDYAEPPHIELVNPRWILRSLNGSPIKPDSAVGDIYIRFQDASLVEGFGGCNRLAGSYAATETKIKIGPLASTRKSCTDDGLEYKFIQAIEASNSYETDSKFLYLKNKENNVVAKLEAIYL
jgi:heat shock protein HslJ